MSEDVRFSAGADVPATATMSRTTTLAPFRSRYMSLPAATGALSFLADSAAACAVHLPALWVARKTVQRRRWAAWTGAAISLLLLIAAAVGLLGNNIMGFETLYDDSILRTMVFGLLSVIFSGQPAAYAGSSAEAAS